MPREKAPLEVNDKKPSLASLKPSAKNSSAKKKRAISRIDAASSKKSTSSRLKQISKTFNDGSLSKTRPPASLPPKKKNKKVSVSQAKNEIKKISTLEKTEIVSIAKKGDKTPPLNVAAKIKQAVAKERARRSPYNFLVSRKNAKSDLESLRPSDALIKLPENMSLRAREKALVILKSFTEDFKHSAEQVSLVSGLCFVVLGSFLSLTFSGQLPNINGQSAQLSSSLSSTTQNTLTSPSTVTPNFAAPSLKVIDAVPTELSATALFTFSLSEVKNVSVRIFSLYTGQSISTNVEQLTNATYRYKIEADKLTPGAYVVKTFSEHIYTNTKYTFVLGEFRVPQPQVNTQNSGTSTSTDDQTTSVTNTTTTNTSSGTGSTGTTNTATTTPTQLAKTDYKIRLDGPSNISGQVALRLVAPVETKTLELYIRPRNSITARFLGLAEKRSDAWYYFFNTVNTPNGDYEIHAKSRIADVFVQSNSLSTKIYNQLALPVETAVQPTYTSTAPTTESSDIVEETDEVDDLETQSVATNTTEAAEESVRTFSDNNFTEATSTLGTLKTSSWQLEEVFKEFETELAELLKRYAVARQSSDQRVLRLVDEEFEKLKQHILSEMLLREDWNGLSDSFATEFDIRLLALKKRIDTFEKLRNTAGIEDIALDSDADGVSDYDERNLYRTDSHAVDSDGDGFDDGVEIMRGYDPRSPKGEVAIEYEQPHDTVGLEDTEMLRVETVLPSVSELSPETKVVQSEIRGRGLPNSFVTLYIFSTPVVVTVKTDADGSFVYTFEKELEDGEHEVYAAITDNSGAIVAQSRPFKFVKQAEAFTPVGSETAVNTVTLADLKQFQMRQIVVGLGILALGAILFMLGAGTRGRRQVLETEATNDIKAT